MEQLTKHQIILLAFLVSFVSSIATGIVVVSLMEQAPQNVVQTVNRIVERTVEVVAPSATTTRETIIVREDQAIVDSIAKASKSVVRIFAQTESGERFVGAGVIVTSSGKVLSATSAASAGSGSALSATLDGGNRVSLELVSRDEASGISVFQAEQGTTARDARAYTAAALGDSSTLKLGQSVAAISGEEELEVATGIVSSLNEGGVHATVPQTRPFDSQAFLVNLSGEVIGMKNGQRTALFVPSNALKPYATP